MAAYLDAVAEIGAEAVERSCQQFSRGLVEGRNNSFLPSAPELSTNARQWQEAIAYVETKRMLAQTQRIVVYKAGELAPPPATPLGPIKLEVGGFMRDVSDWTHEEKEEAMNTGKVPDSVAKRMGGGDVVPRLRSMK